ncbi:MAG TPA: sugar transferase [Anaeromyxobacteraceae bacterium]|jgi:exopolysaccharide biosynthesis polyprenyl glycosylphosphotransferase|nr:sugar transferase [Anaeromyxobacteraceae bacterium]
MLKDRARLVDAGLRLFDLVVLALAFPVAYLVRDRLAGGLFHGIYPIEHYWSILALTLLMWLGASTVTLVYQAYRTRPMRMELGRLFRSMVIVAGGLGVVGFALKSEDVSRLFVGLYFSIALAALLANRVAVRLFLRSLRRRGYNSRRFLVVGSGPSSSEVLSLLGSHPEWGLQCAGCLLEDDGAQGKPVGPVLGNLRDLARILGEQVVDEVIFAMGRERLDGVEEALAICAEQGVGAWVYANFFRRGIAKFTVEDVDGVPMLAFSTVPGDPLALLAKRAADVLASAVALVLLAPLLTLAALAIRLDSPGPVLFRQRRVGTHGREFWLYKFRSMAIDAEAQLGKLKALNEVTGPVFKMRNDPRVTRVGHFIRKTSIDELPQFWNVLRGDMSVVGPRPPVPSEVKEYERWHRRRLSVTPGITCIWQISGRNDVDFDRWMELDLQYIDNWSLYNDLKIFLRTIPAVLTGRGAR